MKNTNKLGSHAVLNIMLPIVFMAKYRRKTLTPKRLDTLKRPLVKYSKDGGAS
jgi:REP element-mobilizing transposase RayT